MTDSPEVLAVKIEHQRELMQAHDRRYAEVALEREKALKIKEEADKAALGLAREIQTYKDEKANELREQINRERGLYATKQDLAALGEKVDAQLKPIAAFVSGSQGGFEVQTQTRARSQWTIGTIIGVAGMIIGIVFSLIAFLVKK